MHNREAKLDKTISYKNNWIRSLHRQGLRPFMEAVDVVNCTWEESHLIEKYWIEQFRQWGFRLTNTGDKGPGHVTSGRNKGALKCQKRVYQYSYDGNLVGEYESARIAERKTGIPYKDISGNCTGLRKSAHGYLWSFTPLFLEAKYRPRNSRGRKVRQYTLDGILIKEWVSVQEAAEALKLSNSTIAGVARRGWGRKTAGGFTWSYDHK